MLQQLFLWLGGADPDITEGLRSERMRMSVTGGTVLTTGVIAACAAALTTRSFLGASWPLTIMAGLGWGAAIMTLDRWMLMSLHRHQRPAMTITLALPRLALAIAGGLTFAGPIDIAAFHGEVARQAHVEVQQERTAEMGRITDYYGPKIAALTRQQDALEGSLQSGRTASFLLKDPIYSSDVSRANTLRQEAQSAQSQAISELAGTGGTHHEGAGPVYDAKEARATQLQSEAAQAQAAAQQRANALMQQDQSARRATQTTATTTLAAVDRQLASLRSAESLDEAKVAAELGRGIGLADRLQALGSVEDSNFSVWMWSHALTLLILLIDAGPVIGKTLLLLGPETAYEREQHRREEHVHELQEAVRASELQATEISCSETVDQAEIHRELWRQELEQLIPSLIETQRDVTRQEIDAWARRVREDAARRERVRTTGWETRDYPFEPRARVAPHLVRVPEPPARCQLTITTSPRKGTSCDSSGLSSSPERPWPPSARSQAPSSRATTTPRRRRRPTSNTRGRSTRSSASATRTASCPTARVPRGQRTRPATPAALTRMRAWPLPPIVAGLTTLPRVSSTLW